MRIIVFLLLAAGEARAERFSLAVGSNIGVSGEEALRYANADAERVDQAMREVGDVPASNAFLLRDANPQTLDAVIDSLAMRVRGGELFFYFSGHGGENELDMGGQAVSLPWLEARLKKLGATLVVSVIDACRTSVGEKGVRAVEAPVVVSGTRTEGFVELRAAAAGEPAQESQELSGAVFTHFWTSGLRGAADANHDGIVTLDELYFFSHAQTLARTATSVAVQRPAFVSQLQGEGTVVVSRPLAADARLSVSTGTARYLVFSLPEREPVGEIFAGEVLALADGRYFVVRRDGALVGVSEVDLSLGGTRDLSAEKFTAVTPEALAARGASDLHPWRLSLSGATAFLLNTADALGGGAVLEGERAFGPWSIGLRALWDFAPVKIANGSGSANEFSGGVFGSYALWDGGVFFALRVLLSVDGGVEKVAQQDAAMLRPLGVNVTATTSYAAFAVRGGFVFAVPLGHRLSARLTADAGPLFRNELSAPESAAMLSADLSVQIALGLSWRL